MFRKISALLLVACLAIGTLGCSITTTGDGSWEIYGGVRTQTEGEGPASVVIKSTVVDSLIDGTVSEQE